MLHRTGMQRIYHVETSDPLALARELGVPLADIALRIGVTRDWTRRLAADYRHVPRVRRAVLELALERERLAELIA